MYVRESALNTSISIVFVRWIAAIIDNLLVTISCLIFPYLLESHYGKTVINDHLVSILFLSSFLFILIYFTVVEGLTGYTIGKWICQIRVVREDGSPPGLGKALIRALFRAFEVNIIGLLGFLVAITSKEKQRLGDMVAKTYVLYNKDINPEERKPAKWKLVPCGFILLLLMTVWFNNIMNLGYVLVYPERVNTENIHYAVSPDSRYRLILPKGWTEDAEYLKDIKGEIKVVHATNYIFLVSQSFHKKEYQGITLQNISSLVKENLRKNATPTKQLKINGYPAVQFSSLVNEGENHYYRYLFTCIEATQSYYLLTCWADEGPFESRMDQMKEISEGFEILSVGGKGSK